MSGHYSLSGLKSRFDAELAEILRVAGLLDGGLGERVAIAEFCIVRLQDSWNRFVRDLILRSALGNASRATGVRVLPGPLGVIRQDAAMRTLRHQWPVGGIKPTWWEPKWFEVRDGNRAITVLQPSNAADLTAALGAATNPIEDVRAIRNFVAHRGATSALRFRAVADALLPGWRQPAEVALARPLPAGHHRLEEWCRRFDLVSAAAVM